MVIRLFFFSGFRKPVIKNGSFRAFCFFRDFRFLFSQFLIIVRVIGHIRKCLDNFLKGGVFGGFGVGDILVAVDFDFFGLFAVKGVLSAHHLIDKVLFQSNGSGHTAGSVFVQLHAQIFVNTAG